MRCAVLDIHYQSSSFLLFPESLTGIIEVNIEAAIAPKIRTSRRMSSFLSFSAKKLRRLTYVSIPEITDEIDTKKSRSKVPSVFMVLVVWGSDVTLLRV